MNNPQAFPRIGQEVNFGNGWIESQDGMTLRQYYAAAALPALIALLKPEVNSAGYILPSQWRPVIGAAYKIADEMLAEIEKESK